MCIRDRLEVIAVVAGKLLASLIGGLVEGLVGDVAVVGDHRDLDVAVVVIGRVRLSLIISRLMTGESLSLKTLSDEMCIRDRNGSRYMTSGRLFQKKR